MLQILYCTKIGKYIHLRARCCQNHLLYNASYKSCWALNFLQTSQWAHVSISSRNRARRLQRLIYFKYYNILKQKIDSVSGLELQKIPITAKNASKKNCSELNFLQKNSMGTHVHLLTLFIYFSLVNILHFSSGFTSFVFTETNLIPDFKITSFPSRNIKYI